MGATSRHDLHEGLNPIRLVAALAASCAAAGTCLLGMTAASAAPSAPAGMAPNLTGQMARWHFILGSWSCAVTSKPSAFNLGFFVTAAPDNALQISVRSPKVEGAGFFGYDSVSKQWWSAYTDNTGARYYQTSRDGITFDGTMTTRQRVVELRSTTTKLTETKIRTVTEERIKNAWVKSGDNTCTKS